MNQSGGKTCPICDNALVSSGPEVTVNEIFSLWQPVSFTQETIAEHAAQSVSTRLYTCGKCNFGIFLPQIIGTPGFYTELQMETSGSYYVDDKWDFEEALKDARTAGSIVEVGCGPGVFLERASHCVQQTIGIEYNEQALNTARRKGLRVFNHKDDLSTLKGQFDIAFSFHVLEHVADPLAFVEAMLLWIKPGGKIGISVPNMDGPLKYVDPCVSNMPPHHATRWKLDTFQELSNKFNLTIERVEYEPLVARDHYYYSLHWVRHCFPGDFLPRPLLSILQRIVSWGFDRMFQILAKFNKKELGLLKGQSVYVLLRSKKGTE